MWFKLVYIFFLIFGSRAKRKRQTHRDRDMDTDTAMWAQEWDKWHWLTIGGRSPENNEEKKLQIYQMQNISIKWWIFTHTHLHHGLMQSHRDRIWLVVCKLDWFIKKKKIKNPISSSCSNFCFSMQISAYSTLHTIYFRDVISLDLKIFKKKINYTSTAYGEAAWKKKSHSFTQQ